MLLNYHQLTITRPPSTHRAVFRTRLEGIVQGRNSKRDVNLNNTLTIIFSRYNSGLFRGEGARKAISPGDIFLGAGNLTGSFFLTAIYNVSLFRKYIRK